VVKQLINGILITLDGKRLIVRLDIPASICNFFPKVGKL